MHRTFTITLPADTAFHSLWDSIVASGACDQQGNTLVSGVKDDGIITDRVCELQIQSQATGTDTISVSDRNNANEAGFTMLKTAAPFITRSSRNSICLKDYYIKGSAVSMPYTATIESI